MISKRLWVALLAATLFAGAEAAAQSNASGGVAVSIESGLFIAKDRDLSFGSIIQPASGGSIQIPPAGAAVVTPGYVVVSSGVSAQFTAGTSVNANQKFWIQLPTTASIVNNTAPGGPYTLTVRDFLVSANVAAACVKYALTPPGPAEKPSCPTVKAGTNLTFQVGATVDINANQAAGTYAGTFAVTVHNL